MCKRFTPNDIRNLSSRIIFFDANVIIDIFWSMTPNNRIANTDSSIFDEIIRNKITKATNSIVISEIINRMIRHEMSKEPNYDNTKYKAFRKTKKGQEIVDNIYQYVKEKILPNFELFDKEFSRIQIQDLLQDKTLDDFNDKLIYSCC
ncbi:MAG: hypothetical protein IKP67_02920, partial [Spirochaetales bacterium]|nr:hypothetical protein [Spirochaetales bacterium]